MSGVRVTAAEERVLRGAVPLPPEPGTWQQRLTQLAAAGIKLPSRAASPTGDVVDVADVLAPQLWTTKDLVREAGRWDDGDRDEIALTAHQELDRRLVETQRSAAAAPDPRPAPRRRAPRKAASSQVPKREDPALVAAVVAREAIATVALDWDQTYVVDAVKALPAAAGPAPAGPQPCEVCSVLVSAAYIAKTGRARHGHHPV